MEELIKPKRAIEQNVGILGLIVAIGLGGLRIYHKAFGGSGPFDPLYFQGEVFGNLVFILILGTPYLVALYSARLPAGTRWLILLSAAILALPATLISFSLIGFLFIPGIILLFTAVGRSLDRNRVAGIFTALGAVMIVVIIISVGAPGCPCFNTTMMPEGGVFKTLPDGHTEWESVPQTPGHLSSGVIQAPSGGTSGFYATSDIIANIEAACAGGLLLLAWVEIGVLGVYFKKRWPEPPAPPPDIGTIATLPNSS